MLSGTPAFWLLAVVRQPQTQTVLPLSSRPAGEVYKQNHPFLPPRVLSSSQPFSRSFTVLHPSHCPVGSKKETGTQIYFTYGRTNQNSFRGHVRENGRNPALDQRLHYSVLSMGCVSGGYWSQRRCACFQKTQLMCSGTECLVVCKNCC